jgi:hypothetical protein
VVLAVVNGVVWLESYASLIGFLIGLPVSVATYYQVFRARSEAEQARQGIVISENCLEFVQDDGATVNVVPLETLHSLPKPGDIVLLPGMDEGAMALPHGAYRVSRIEHLYAPVKSRRAHAGQARLAKAVAHVDRLG